MDPVPEVAGRDDPDLDAIARDLAEVEAELDRLAGAYGDDDHSDTGPAAS